MALLLDDFNNLLVEKSKMTSVTIKLSVTSATSIKATRTIPTLEASVTSSLKRKMAAYFAT